MQLEAQKLEELLAAIGAKSPTPGGGAVAGIVAALAAALGRMVVSYSEGKASLVAHATIHERAAEALRSAQRQATRLADEDEVAYAALNELLRLPESDERRRREMRGAVDDAIRVPTELIDVARAILAQLEELTGRSNRMLASDLAIAAILAEAAAHAAAWNVRINLPLVGVGEERAAVEMRMERAIEGVADVRGRVEKAAGKTLK